MVTAPDAQAGLDILLGDIDIAVVVSDLMMPGIDGITFLRQAMIVSPYSARILLTGYWEAVSMSVVLDRQLIFKILEKPCVDSRLLEAIERGVEDWRTRVERAATGG